MSLTFENDDALGRKPFADRLTKAVTTFYPFADGAYVLSLNAKFGTGKTTFLKMWTNELENPEDKHTVIFIDAWKTDFAQNPAIPIISAFLEQLPNKGKGIRNLKAGFRGAIGASALVANNALAGATGVNVKDILSSVEEDLKAEDLESIGRELDKRFHYQIDAFEEIRKQLKSYVEGLEGKPLIVMVDELDRARPDYAVEFLETIKHLFSVEGIVFVLAVNKEQLKSSVKVLFGEHTDFENYYRRFITREVDLPQPKVENWHKFIVGQYEEYFERKMESQLHFISNNIDGDWLLRDLTTITAILRFDPRETQSFFRVLCHLLLASSDKENRSPLDVWGCIFMSALLIKDRVLYHRFGKAEMDKEELKTFLDSLEYPLGVISERELHLTYRELILELSVNYNNRDAYTDLIKEYRDSSVPLKFLEHKTSRKSTFENIYTRIEHWKTFVEQ